ncbi:FecR family protein [Pedobacter sp. ok626]|uniref:FecR family protein n=1 Tax=Pedobacter sp. ok626 TaxID=1761882 RepID=UPI00087FC268|nr:FecR family protein [Pedobacter sp. ok626]SDK64843.1 FecR family protein [Pedobacter sp. ok626]
MSRINQICKLFFQNNYSKDLQQKFFGWLSMPVSMEQKEEALKELWESIELPFDAAAEASYLKVYERISPAENKVHFLMRFRWVAAAVIAVVLLGIAFYSFNGSQVLNQLVALGKPVKYHINPGTNKATLRLADGSTINLDNSAEPSLTNYGNIQIKKNSNGQIIYQVIADSTDTEFASTYNVFTTPKGGQYEIILADGSKVLLNANSSLTFPTVFSATQRYVVLKGEAYFEIAKNKKKPFKVSANGTEIKVLGTHFNVMAYEDEPELKTTLFEGSVQVGKNNVIKVIKPGQQATTYQNKIEVSKANLDEVMAWRNGYFIFKDESIESAIRKIARWYDVEIIYKGAIPTNEISGRISRYQNIWDVLKPLEVAGSIHFKLEGRRIIVMP